MVVILIPNLFEFAIDFAFVKNITIIKNLERSAL